MAETTRREIVDCIELHFHQEGANMKRSFWLWIAVGILFVLPLILGAASLVSAHLSAQSASSIIVPDGWKLTKNAGCNCEAAVPGSWQEGKDFSFERAAARKLILKSGAVVKFAQTSIQRTARFQAKKGETISRYELRASILDGDNAYSIYRVRNGSPFSADEKAAFSQIGSTLRLAK
jgi:hypothetical protein